MEESPEFRWSHRAFDQAALVRRASGQKMKMDGDPSAKPLISASLSSRSAMMVVLLLQLQNLPSHTLSMARCKGDHFCQSWRRP